MCSKHIFSAHIAFNHFDENKINDDKTGNKKIVEEAAAKDSGAKKSNGKGVARVEEEGEDDTELFFSSFNEDAREKVVKRLPSAFFCPITKEVMKYPVIAADGHTYEREAIKKWLHEHKTSPTTNLVLRHTHVIPNHSLKSAIQIKFYKAFSVVDFFLNS